MNSVFLPSNTARMQHPLRASMRHYPSALPRFNLLYALPQTHNVTRPKYPDRTAIAFSKALHLRYVVAGVFRCPVAQHLAAPFFVFSFVNIRIFLDLDLSTLLFPVDFFPRNLLSHLIPVKVSLNSSLSSGHKGRV